MSTIIPNFEWYSSQSKTWKLSPRCPIASSELCPRYYDSLCLLGKRKIITEIPPEDRIRLDNKWKLFMPVIDEEAAYAGGEDGWSFANLCPEVGFDVFGYFASSFHRYVDEIDVESAHKQLKREGVDGADPRWHWSTVAPRHYTECREYSIHLDVVAGKIGKSSKTRLGPSPEVRWQILARDNFSCQYCGRRPPEISLEVDHKVPISRGGGNDLDNLIAACMDCNRRKGTENTNELKMAK
jgi:5-methylcytosine-specific restriction endonuclease McrA